MVQIRKRDKNNNNSLIWWGNIRRKLLFRSSAAVVSSRRTSHHHNKGSNSSIIVLHTNDGNFSEVEEEEELNNINIVDGSEFLLSRENIAAVTIQTCFRAHLARRAFRALKSLVKLQALVRGVVVRRQARIALNCMNALARLQITVRARQLLINHTHPNYD